MSIHADYLAAQLALEAAQDIIATLTGGSPADYTAANDLLLDALEGVIVAASAEAGDLRFDHPLAVAARFDAYSAHKRAAHLRVLRAHGLAS